MFLSNNGPRQTSWSAGPGGSPLLKVSPAVVLLRLAAPDHNLPPQSSVLVAGGEIVVYSIDTPHTPPMGMVKMTAQHTLEMGKTIARAFETTCHTYDITDRVVEEFLYQRVPVLATALINTGEMEYTPPVDFVALAKYMLEIRKQTLGNGRSDNIFARQVALEEQAIKDLADLKQNPATLGAFVLQRRVLHEFLKAIGLDLTPEETAKLNVWLEEEKTAMLKTIKQLIAQERRSRRLAAYTDPDLPQTFKAQDGTALHTLILSLQENEAVLFDAIVTRDRLLGLMVDEGVVATPENLFKLEGKVRDICHQFEKGSLDKLVFALQSEFGTERRR